MEMCCTNTHRSKGCTCRVERYRPVNTGARKSFQSVILGQRFTTRSLTTPPTKNDMTPQADCKYLAVSPTNQQKKAGKPHPSDDSATLHDRTSVQNHPKCYVHNRHPKPCSFRASTPGFLQLWPLAPKNRRTHRLLGVQSTSCFFNSAAKIFRYAHEVRAT